MEKEIYKSQWKVTEARANEMKAISAMYKNSEHIFEKELSKIYEALMMDYRYISHSYYIFAFPEPGQPNKPEDLKIVYNRLIKNHADAAVAHKNALSKLGFQEFWHIHFQKYHEFMEGGHKNYLSHLK